MEVKAPSWLNAELLQTALKSASDPDPKVISFEVKNATAAGDNYSSDMYRVKVNYTQGDTAKTTSVIVKVAKHFDIFDKISTELNPFQREINVFTHILPYLQDFLRDIFPGKFQPFGANLLHSSNELSTTYLIMEDLKESGFKIAERMRGLDMNHSLLVMKNLGRYHAASVVLHEKQPEKLRYFMESFYNPSNKDMMDKFYNGILRNVAREVETWPDYKERFASKLHKLADDPFMHCVNAVKRDEEEFNVLCHGDLWLNNMMFRYSEETGEVVDVRFVDYQIGYWTSPAVDLQYFFHTSVSTDLIDKRHVLIQEYYNSLTDTLTKLGYKHLQPTMSQLEKQLNKRGLHAVMTSTTALPIIIVDKINAPDINELINKGNKIHLSEAYNSAMKKFLPVFEERGWI
ncbi:uncharacterized protein [Periplaneta americana]|uniref:uncharacterized protein n=1 Tax=Periplaneta americana TaxID=6978 RepID=UPI0037E7F26F